jgi:hypothetical protein
MDYEKRSTPKPGTLGLAFLTQEELMGRDNGAAADLRALIAERDDAVLLAEEYGRRLREANRDVDGFGAEADTLRARCERLEAALRELVAYRNQVACREPGCKCGCADAFDRAAALAGEGKS